MTKTDFQKINEILNKYQKDFTENSSPVYLDDKGNKMNLKQIFNNESINGNPVTIIAVTRNQYDTKNFAKYVSYVREDLQFPRHYYGLWPDTKNDKVEYDVSYVIPTNNSTEIQKNLNQHNHLNDQIPQSMGLVIFQDGNYKVIKNQEISD